MLQGRKVLAANLGPVTGAAEEFAEWRHVSADLASNPDLSEARVLLGMVRGLPRQRCPGAAAGWAPGRQLTAAASPLGPVALGLVTPWACGGMCSVWGAGVAAGHH
jgi:hypothetical protein